MVYYIVLYCPTGNVHGVYKPGNVVLRPELLDDFQRRPGGGVSGTGGDE